MKISIITNFSDYRHEIDCDKFGVITLKLIPNFDVNIRQNHKHKIGKTIFRNKYCTLYKKKNNSYLYKYTNHKPILNTFENEYVESVLQCLPINDNYKYFSRIDNFKYNYRKNKSNRYYKKMCKYKNIYNSFNY